MITHNSPLLFLTLPVIIIMMVVVDVTLFDTLFDTCIVKKGVLHDHVFASCDVCGDG